MAKPDKDEAQRETTRRRYEPPAVVETGAFDRLVLACGHTPLETEDPTSGCTVLNMNS